MPLQKRTAIVYHTCAMSSQERIPHPVSLACVEPWMTPDAKPPQTLQERVLGGVTSVPRTARTIAGNLGLEASFAARASVSRTLGKATARIFIAARTWKTIKR